MKFVLSSFTNIRLDILERRRSGACMVVFVFEAKEAIDGYDTMKKYMNE